MKYILTATSAGITERSEEMRTLFDCAIKNFGSIKVVNEFSELPNGDGFEWGESRYVEIPTEHHAPYKLQSFLGIAKSQSISVEPMTDPQPQKITW